MSKIALDLKKFKHVKSDDKTTTLRHKDGHELTISKKALSPEFQEQLSALNKGMAFGGTFSEVDEAQKSASKTPQTTTVHHSADEDDKLQKAREAGERGTQQLRQEHPEPQEPKEEGYTDYARGGKVKTQTPNDSLSSGKGGTSTQGNDVRNKDMRSAKNEAHGRRDMESHNKPNIKGLADGGEVEGYEKLRKYSNNYAEGGMQGSPMSPAQMGLPCLNPNCKSHGKPHPNCRCYSGGENFAEGGKAEIKHVCEIEAKHYPDCEYYNDPIQTDDPNCYKDGGEVEGKEVPKLDIEGLKNEAVQSAQQSSDNPQEQQQYLNKEAGKIAEQAEADKQQLGPVPQQQPADQLLQNSTQPNEQVPQQPQQPEAQGKPLQVTAQNPDKVNDPIARLAFYRQMEKDDMANHNAEWEQDLRNGHITPETYSSLFAKKDTLGKIGTLFGMLIGGAGAGLSHQPSLIMQMMDKQIQNDLEAQKTSKADAQNYLRLSQQHEMNRAQIPNLNADTATKSYALAQSRMLQSSFHDLEKKVMTMPEGPAKETAKQNLGMIYNQVGQKINNLQDAAAGAGAYYKMLGMDSGQQGDLSATQKQRRSQSIIGSSNPFAAAAQYDTEHTVPGMKGQTDVPVPQGTRDQINAQNVLDYKVRDVLDYARKHAGTIKPSEIAKAKQKAEELTAYYNKSVDNLGMTQGRLGWLEEQIKKNPTNIIQQIMGNNARLEEIRDSNLSRRDLAMKNMGDNANQSQSEPDGKQETIERIDPKSGKTVIYDAKTKKPLRWK